MTAVHHMCLPRSDPGLRDVMNDGQSAKFKTKDLTVSAEKSNQHVKVDGSFGQGSKYSIDISGDPHAVITITGPDGTTTSQKFDFKKDAAMQLPDGKMLLAGTNGGTGDAPTYADSIGILSPDGELSTIKNINSPGALEVDTKRTHGNALEVIDRELGGADGFAGKLYNMTPKGLMTGDGTLATSESVASQEARSDRRSNAQLGRYIGLNALADGLRPRGTGPFHVDRFLSELGQMAAMGGGVMRMRNGSDDYNCMVGGRDFQDEFSSGCGNPLLDGITQNRDCTQARRHGSLSPALSSWVLGKHMQQENPYGQLSLGELRGLAASQDHFTRLAASSLLNNTPREFHDQLQLQGGVSMRDLQQYAYLYDYES